MAEIFTISFLSSKKSKIWLTVLPTFWENSNFFNDSRNCSLSERPTLFPQPLGKKCQKSRNIRVLVLNNFCFNIFFVIWEIIVKKLNFTPWIFGKFWNSEIIPMYEISAFSEFWSSLKVKNSFCKYRTKKNTKWEVK